LSAVSVPARQHGSSVHGSVVVSQSAAGGRLEVSVLAKGASLGGIRSAQVRVGRLVRAALPAGTSHFAVPLSARARHALKLHRRLALTLAIVFTPAHGPATKVTRAVVVQI
jgi:hypothetical protein